MTNLERAAQCRRLAYEIPGEPLADVLLALADEFECRARNAVDAGEQVAPGVCP